MLEKNNLVGIISVDTFDKWTFCVYYGNRSHLFLGPLFMYKLKHNA